MSFISAHLIVRERTNLGARFIAATLESLVQSGYPDEIVIIDNGSIEKVFEVYEKYRKKFLTIKLLKSRKSNFTDLRNECLRNTDPRANYFHLIDSDEIYYPVDLRKIKDSINGRIKMAKTNMFHFMINPWQVQFCIPRSCIYKMTSNIAWTGGVHEVLENQPQGGDIHIDVNFLHYGYIRQQWLTCLKWLQYDWIEKGNLDSYKWSVDKVTGERKEWLRDWRVPNGVLNNRKSLCTPFTKEVPLFIKNIVFDSAGFSKEVNAANWSEFLDYLDPNPFWQEWQERYRMCGSWTATLDWVADRMVGCNWSI